MAGKYMGNATGFWALYSTMKTNLKYQLGVGLMAVCYGGHVGTPGSEGGRDLFTNHAKFHGVDRVYYSLLEDVDFPAIIKKLFVVECRVPIKSSS